MFKYITLIIFIAAIYGGKINSNENLKSTNTFIKYADAPETLFMKESFNVADMCKKFNSRSQFISILLKKNINCRGWCHQNSYQYAGLDTYQAEHIIDLKNSILPNCNKNIYGNMILAYGRWNNEIGQLNWGNIKREKH